MQVTVIGAGNMGAAFVKQLSLAGHQVRVAARDLEKAQALASQHANAQAVPVANAAVGSNVVILATGYNDAAAALQSVGDLTGKVVVDITNPLSPDYMSLTVGHSTSAAEQIAAAVPGANVVKGFNTLFAQVLGEGADLGQGRKATVFLAGDDAVAKETVKGVAESMGFVTQDAGGLRNARYLEPLAGLNIYLGYGAGLGTAIAPAWVQRA
jgi:8-hydroxy-5-deazaflavin:NADPH oxidoreductase